jgi:hypothetical protein
MVCCIGVSQKKKGPEGIVPRLVFDNLCNAFESYIQIKELNGLGTEITNNKLIELLKKCTRSVIILDCKNLLNHLLKSTALELTSGRSNNAEERLVHWTIYFNIKSCFDNWEWDLLELGFAEVDSKGKTVIPTAQLEKIININETCLFWMGASATEVAGQKSRFTLPIYPILVEPQLKLVQPLQ